MTLNEGKTLRYVAGLVLPGEWLRLFIAGLTATTAAFAANLPAIWLGRLVDAGLSAETASAWRWLFYIAMVLLAREALVVGQRVLVETTATSIWKRICVRANEKILSVPCADLQAVEAGDLAVRVERGVSAATRIVKLGFLDLAPNLAMAIVAIGLAMTMHWSMAIILPGIVVVGAGLTYWQLHSQRGVRVRIENAKAKLGGMLTRLVIGLPYLRASGQRQSALSEITKSAEEARSTEMSHHHAMMRFDAAKQLVEGSGFTLAIGVAIVLAMRGAISPGDILALAVLFRSATTPIQHLHRVFDELHEALAQADILFKAEAMRTDPGLEGRAEIVVTEAPAIECVGLGVALGTATLIDAIDVTIPRGQRVGLAGPTGGGKSTLIKTCLGLYPDYRGQALIFGAHVATLDKDKLSQRVAYCPQEPFIFPASVRHNLECARPSKGALTDREIWRALELVRLADRIRGLSGGLDAVLTEFGRELSGGERQRLMIARTILTDADIFFFDECTSNVDPATERVILDNLGAALAGKTCIFIAHRLNTLLDLDRVVVLKNGRLAQDGPPHWLAASPGHFREMLEEGVEAHRPLPTTRAKQDAGTAAAMTSSQR